MINACPIDYMFYGKEECSDIHNMCESPRWKKLELTRCEISTEGLNKNN